MEKKINVTESIDQLVELTDLIIIIMIVIIVIIIIIVSIIKCSIVIGSLCAYLIRNWRVITWVSNYSCPI